MKVEKISEYGFEEAALGFSLSYNTSIDRAKQILVKYAHGVPGESKFLESMIIYVDVQAPRYFWQEGDTYRIATKQSESTMHTLMKKRLTQENFEEEIFENTIFQLNILIDKYKTTNELANKKKIFRKIKNNLPEGFLQRRIWMISYKTMQNIVAQRSSHKLEEWHWFIDTVLNSLDHKEFIFKEDGK